MSWAVILTPGIMATTIHGITVVGDTTHGMADITAPIIPGGHPGVGTGVGARLGAGDPPGDGAHRGVGDRRGVIVLNRPPEPIVRISLSGSPALSGAADIRPVRGLLRGVMEAIV